MPLSFLFIARRLAALYDLVFPERPDWLDEELDWTEDEDVARATAEFLERVEQHRFPVDTEVVDIDAETCEWVLWHVPVMPQGFAAGFSDEWEYFREPAQLLIKLAYSDCLVEDRQAYLAQEYPQFSLPAGLNTAGLSRVLRQVNLDGPLLALPDMLDMVHEETGNAWLDYDYESVAEAGSFPEWEADHDWLAEEWAKARPIADRVFALMSWVEGDLERRLQLVVDTLLAAHNRRQTRSEEDDDDR